MVRVDLVCIYCDAMNIPGATKTIEIIGRDYVCSMCGKHWPAEKRV